MNISQISKMSEMKSHWERFQRDHPRVLRFFQAVGSNAVCEGTVIEIRVTTPGGETYETNMKLNADDVDTVNFIKEMQ